MKENKTEEYQKGIARAEKIVALAIMFLLLFSGALLLHFFVENCR